MRSTWIQSIASVIAPAMIPALALAGLAACSATPLKPSSTPDAGDDTPYLGDGAFPVGDRLYVGGQPDAMDFAELKAAGITKVVSFRTPPEMADLGFDEPALLGELGIDYINIPVGGDEYGYTQGQIGALAEVLDGTDEKVLLHCTVGWRASMATVAYLVQEENMPLDEALSHAQRWWPLQLEKMLGRPLELRFAEDSEPAAQTP